MLRAAGTIRQEKAKADDELALLKLQLDREKEDSKLLNKDIQELQYKLNRSQEDKTVEARIKDLRGDVTKETEQRI
ncbi:hypothetical protein DIPPA_13577, partial [Diplonema papillatum]